MTPALKAYVIAIGIFGLIIISVFFLFRDSHKITNYPTSGSTIVIFGDSLAAGEGVLRNENFASLLSTRLKEPIINLGVSGNTTKDGLARVDQVLNQDPKVVILLLGGNDALRRIPVEETFSNLAEIIKLIQASGAAVLLVGEPGGLYGTRYPDEFERLAEEYGVAYVPNILKGLIGRPEYMVDTIHPNAAGHVLMADRVEPLLVKLLEGS